MKTIFNKAFVEYQSKQLSEIAKFLISLIKKIFLIQNFFELKTSNLHHTSFFIARYLI